MKDDLSKELLRGMPVDAPDFWDRVDARLIAAGADRLDGAGASEAPPISLEIGEVIDLRSGTPDRPLPGRWVRPLVAAAVLAVVAFAAWGVLGNAVKSDTTTVAVSEGAEMSGTELVRDAEARDVESIDTGFGPPFEFEGSLEDQQLATLANLIRNDPEVVRFVAASGSVIEVDLTSIEESTLLRLVSPTGQLVLDVSAPHVSSFQVTESGEWVLIVEAIGRSDRLDIDVRVVSGS